MKRSHSSNGAISASVAEAMSSGQPAVVFDIIMQHETMGLTLIPHKLHFAGRSVGCFQVVSSMYTSIIQPRDILIEVNGKTCLGSIGLKDKESSQNFFDIAIDDLSSTPVPRTLRVFRLLKTCEMADGITPQVITADEALIMMREPKDQEDYNNNSPQSRSPPRVNSGVCTPPRGSSVISTPANKSSGAASPYKVTWPPTKSTNNNNNNNSNYKNGNLTSSNSSTTVKTMTEKITSNGQIQGIANAKKDVTPVVASTAVDMSVPVRGEEKTQLSSPFGVALRSVTPVEKEEKAVVQWPQLRSLDKGEKIPVAQKPLPAELYRTALKERNDNASSTNTTPPSPQTAPSDLYRRMLTEKKSPNEPSPPVQKSPDTTITDIYKNILKGTNVGEPATAPTAVAGDIYKGVLKKPANLPIPREIATVAPVPSLLPLKTTMPTVIPVQQVNDALPKESTESIPATPIPVLEQAPTFHLPVGVTLPGITSAPTLSPPETTNTTPPTFHLPVGVSLPGITSTPPLQPSPLQPSPSIGITMPTSTPVKTSSIPATVPTQKQIEEPLRIPTTPTSPIFAMTPPRVYLPTPPPPIDNPSVIEKPAIVKQPTTTTTTQHSPRITTRSPGGASGGVFQLSQPEVIVPVHKAAAASSRPLTDKTTIQPNPISTHKSPSNEQSSSVPETLPNVTRGTIQLVNMVRSPSSAPSLPVSPSGNGTPSSTISGGVREGLFIPSAPEEVDEETLDADLAAARMRGRSATPSPRNTPSPRSTGLGSSTKTTPSPRSVSAAITPPSHFSLRNPADMSPERPSHVVMLTPMTPPITKEDQSRQASIREKVQTMMTQKNQGYASTGSRGSSTTENSDDDDQNNPPSAFMRVPLTSANGENTTPLSFISCVLSMPVTLGSWLFTDNDDINNQNGTMNNTKSRTKEGTLIFDRESTVVSGAAPPGSIYRDHHDGTYYRGQREDQNNINMSSRSRGMYPQDTTTTGTTANDKKRKKKRTSNRKNSQFVGSPESQGPEPARYY